MKYTLDTDFSALNGPKAANWLRNFTDMTEGAFAGRDNQTRMLGNLLVTEMCAHTLRQGLEEESLPFPTDIQHVLDVLWDCLGGQVMSADTQSFANDLYACVLEHEVGEDLTDAQIAFYKEYFENSEGSTYEWSILVHSAVLLMEWIAIHSGRLDYDEFEACEQIDFTGVSEWLDFFPDVCIEFTNTPCPSDGAKDVKKAVESVYQTPLVRQLVNQIQCALKTALVASPDQYGVLREEYQTHGILPDKYALDLIQF